MDDIKKKAPPKPKPSSLSRLYTDDEIKSDILLGNVIVVVVTLILVSFMVRLFIKCFK